MPRAPWAIAAIAVAASLGLSSAGSAEPAAGAGVGTYDCAQFNVDAATDAPTETLYLTWAQGWMTGWNLAQMDEGKPIHDLSQPPVPDQRAFLRDYCRKNPHELFMKAAYALFASMPVVKAAP